MERPWCNREAGYQDEAGALNDASRCRPFGEARRRRAPGLSAQLAREAERLALAARNRA
jgi:hypothetical protein